MEGRFVSPWWPPIEYLVRVFDAAPAKVMDIVSKFSNTKNIWVLEGILKIVLKADSADAILRFYHFIISYIENCHCSNELIISLLKKSFIFDPQLSEVTSTLLLKIIEFHKILVNRKNGPQERKPRSLEYHTRTKFLPVINGYIRRYLKRCPPASRA